MTQDFIFKIGVTIIFLAFAYMLIVNLLPEQQKELCGNKFTQQLRDLEDIACSFRGEYDENDIPDQISFSKYDCVERIQSEGGNICWINNEEVKSCRDPICKEEIGEEHSVTYIGFGGDGVAAEDGTRTVCIKSLKIELGGC